MVFPQQHVLGQTGWELGALSHASPGSRGSTYPSNVRFFRSRVPTCHMLLPLNPPFTFPLFEMRGAVNFSGSGGEYSCQK